MRSSSPLPAGRSSAGWIVLATLAAACGDDASRPAADATSATGTDATEVADGGGETSPVGPTLGAPEVPASIVVGEPAVVRVAWTAPASGLDVVLVTRTDALGTGERTIAPERLGMTGAGGTLSLSIPTASLPFGPVSYTLVVRDHDGRASPPITFGFDVRGSGAGAPPGLSAVTLEDPIIVRPRAGRDRVRPGLALGFADPDGDVARVRIVVTPPDGDAWTIEEPAARWGITGAAGEGAGRPLTLRQADALGDYTLTLTLFDRAGNASAPVTTVMSLVASEGRAAPALTSATPDQAPPGAEIVLAGAGFEAEPGANVVRFGHAVAEVVAASETALTVIVPEDASTGPLSVSGPRGVAFLDDAFVVPAGLTLTADATTVALGGTLALSARAASLGDPTLTWEVDGIAGGDASRGTIDDDGVYRAPVTMPASGAVTVAVAVAGGPRAELALRLVPPVTDPGAARVPASTGGAVVSEDASARLVVPPGALGADTTITLAPLPPRARPIPEPGRRLEAAIELGPSGLVFASPATLTLTLDRAFAPGATLRLRQAMPDGTWGSPITAIVDASGARASAPIAHFSTYAVEADAEPSGAPAPSALAMSPAELVEGARTPVLLTGVDLTADLVASVRRAGAVTTDVVATGLRATGDQAGVLLDVGVLADLADAASRTYTLVLSTPEGREAGIDFVVRGLDEWTVPAGATVTLTDPSPATYSAIDVRGTVELASGALDASATRRVVIAGTIDGQGRAGGDADGREPGAVASGGSAGAGGRGRSGDSPDELGHGGHGEPCYGDQPGCTRANRTWGQGGEAGEDVGLLDTIIDAIVDLAGCVLGSVVSCISLVADIVAIVEDVDDLASDGGHGHGGFGSAAGGSGGGGGGGGNHDWFLYAEPGGGGGAGGEPGRPVQIVSGGDLVLDGAIRTAGGDGGAGSQVGFGGGGGGGGAGGSLLLAAGGVVRRGPAAALARLGGAGGLGGYTEIDIEDGPAAGTTRRFYFRSGMGGAGYGGTLRVSDGVDEVGVALIDPGTLDHGVTGRAVHAVRVRSVARVAAVRVLGDGGASAITELEAVPGAFGEFTGTIVLFPGHNVVTAGSVPFGGGFTSGAPPMLAKRVLLVASDLDADGLADEDEAIIGSDPADRDSDDDGVPDGSEVAAGTSPVANDSDGDGLIDADEIRLGLDPDDPDGDGDGDGDGLEVVVGSDPASPASAPTTFPAGLLFAQRGADLVVLDPATGRLGVIGRPAGGLGFGLAFASATELYIATLTRLGTADPRTAAPTDIGAYGSSGAVTLRTTTIAWHPSDKVLYGIELGPSPGFAPTGQVLLVDPDDGSAIRLGAPYSAALHALAFDDSGALFATAATPGGADRLVRLDPATGQVSAVIGSTGASGVFGLAFVGATLYATVTDAARSELVTLDLTTGVATRVARLPGFVFDLAARGSAAGPPGGACTPPPGDTDCDGNGLGDTCDVPPMLTGRVDVFTDAYGDVVAGDVDGDLAADLVTVGGDGVVLLRGQGDGTFATAEVLHETAGALALGDLDGDLDLDLVVAVSAAGTVATLLNDGQGTFTPGEVVTVGTAPADVTLADLDGDLDLDLITANAGVSVGFGVAEAGVAVALRGAGGFGAPTLYPEAGRVEHVIAADLDGDGASELLVQVNAATLYLNDGGGGLTRDPDPLGPFYAYDGFAALDVDGDADVDLVVGTGLWLNDGAGGLTAGPTLPTAGTLAALDLDGDLDRDLVAGSSSAGSTAQEVGLLANDGAGAFALRHSGASTPGGYGTTDAAVADFDDDGVPDVALSSFGFQFEVAGQPWFAGVSVFLGRGHGGLDFDQSGVPDACE